MSGAEPTTIRNEEWAREAAILKSLNLPMYDHILVTGGAGFAGSSPAIHLKDEFPESTVTAFDNLHRNGSALNVPRLTAAGVRFVHGDIRSPEAINVLPKPPDLAVERSAEPSAQAGYMDLHHGPQQATKRRDLPVILVPNTYSPFNSPSTVFFRQAFPLIYLPCFVSFRMTDIWRSFVAQAVLSCQGQSLAFRSPVMKQIRNAHNLMRDFSDEVCGYLHNDAIVQTLRRAIEAEDPSDSAGRLARVLWSILITSGFVDDRERPVMEAWSDECLKHGVEDSSRWRA